MGDESWPNPDTPEALHEVLKDPMVGSLQRGLDFHVGENSTGNAHPAPVPDSSHPPRAENSAANTQEPQASGDMIGEREKNPAELLFAAARISIERLGRAPVTEAEVADALQIEKVQAKMWLQRLVEEGVLEKKAKPVRYVAKESQLL